jgi:hypothetical protein
MKSSCPKRCVNASIAPDFCCGSVVQQWISGGGEWGCEDPAFLNSLHARIRSGTKGASAIGPQLWGEVVSAGSRGQKCPISFGLFSPHAIQCATAALKRVKSICQRLSAKKWQLPSIFSESEHFWLYLYIHIKTKTHWKIVSKFHPYCLTHHTTFSQTQTGATVLN